MTSYIDKNLHTYGRVNTDWATRYYSDRFLNSNEMVCPTRLTFDSNGRAADHYSLVTTSAGCTSANERILVEDDQRPKLFSMPGLNSLGIEGGHFCTANNFPAQNTPGLVPDHRAVYSQNLRNDQWNTISEKVQYYKRHSGM